MKNYSSNIRLISLLGWALCLFWTSTGAAQEAPAARLDSTEREKVDIDNADVWQVLQGTGDEITQRLIGNVELSQDSIYMYADSADLVNSVQLYAYDNVIIQQGDSIAAFSDRLDYNAEDKIAHLRRNVILQNGDRELYTDALTYDLATKLATYTTGGRLTDGDTELRSTYGYYYGDTDQIYFRDSVVVVGEEFEMRADTLRYDATNETVHFLGPTVIRTDTAEIYCEAGYYKVEDEIAVFRNNAQYRSGEQIATADSITYRGDLGTYFLDGNAYVREGDERLARAKRIRIKREEEIYELQGNGLFIDSTRTVRGDTIKVDQSQNTYSVSGGQPEVIDGTMILSAKDIDFDEASGIGRARGNVIWRDTSANLEIQAERADYNEATGYLKASGGRGDRPLLITLLEGDSLFVTADTLFSREVYVTDEANTTSSSKTSLIDTLTSDSISINTLSYLDSTVQDTTIITNLAADTTHSYFEATNTTADTQRIVSAYRDVRVYKNDLQALCDSMAFNTTDSILTLFQNPVMWQDTSQLIADTIDLYLQDDALDKVHLKRKALVVTSPDLIFFNQVKGKDIYAYFDTTGLRRTDVSGNAEVIYYAQDEEDAYIGVNKTACSEMSLDFENGSMRFIRLLTMPSGRLDPIKQISEGTQPKLDGFRWETTSRPKSLEDLFGPALRKEESPLATTPVGKPAYKKGRE